MERYNGAARAVAISVHPNGFGISPYLQEKLLFLGQSEVYKQAGELACEFFGLLNLTSRIYRLTNHYGVAIAYELDLVPEPRPTHSRFRAADTRFQSNFFWKCL